MLPLLLSILAGVCPAWAALLAPGTGLQGVFFENTDFTGRRVARTDATINFTWVDGKPPAEGLPGSRFAAQWWGFIAAPVSETITVTTISTGSLRLWIDGTLVIDNWSQHGQTENSGTLAMTAGTLYRIGIDTIQYGGAATLQFYWSAPSLAKAPVPTSQLYPPVFAPKKLVYAGSQDLRASAIYLACLGSEPKRVTELGNGEPRPNRDGRLIAFVSARSVNWDDPKVTRNTDIYVMDANGGRQRRLTRHVAEKKQPAFSADDKWIAYAARAGEHWQIWLMRADGTHPTPVTNNAFENIAPCPGPDGAQIVYQSQRDGKWNIFRCDADGGNDTALTSDGGTAPIFSPKGDKIVFTSTRDGNAELYLMNVDGTAPTRLTNSPSETSAPAFTSDGKGLVYSEIDAEGHGDAWLMDLATRVTWKLTASGDIFSPRLLPAESIPSKELLLWLRADNLNLISGDRVEAWMDSNTQYAAIPTAPGHEPPIFQRHSLVTGLPALRFNGNAGLTLTPDALSARNMFAYVVSASQATQEPWARMVSIITNAENGDDVDWITGLNVVTRGPDTEPPFPPRLYTGANTTNTTAYQLVTISIGTSRWCRFRGDIAEVLIFTDKLGTNDQESVTTYLKAKYHLP